MTRDDELDMRAAELAHDEVDAWRGQDWDRMRSKQRARAALYIEFGPDPPSHEATADEQGAE